MGKDDPSRLLSKKKYLGNSLVTARKRRSQQKDLLKLEKDQRRMISQELEKKSFKKDVELSM